MRGNQLNSRILYIDLESGKTRHETLSGNVAHLFLGGVNAKLTLDHIPPHVDPLAPENVIIIGAGPLVGSGAPGGNKTIFTTKGALTETIVSAPAGHFGHILKAAGWDHLVLQGRCREPSILIIDDSRVLLKTAADLWGRDIFETTDLLLEDYPHASVAAIGPAGENQVSFSIILINKKAMWARGGTGAVMGAKKLKAIVVRGSQQIRKAKSAHFQVLVREYIKKLNNDPNIDLWRRFGIYIGWDAFMQAGQIVYDNFRTVFPVKECTNLYGADAFTSQIHEMSYGCPFCTVRCKHHIRVKDGPNKDLQFYYSDFFSTVEFGARCGVGDYENLAKCAEATNRMGLECVSIGAVLEYLIEMYHLGSLRKTDFDYTPSRGFKETLQLIHDISYRKGVGEIVARGWRKMVDYFGHEDQAVHIKGIDPSWDLRIHMGTESFGKLTGNRGAHANRALSVTQVPGRSTKSIIKYARKIGVPESALARLYNQNKDAVSMPRLLKWVEDYNTMLTYIGICNRAPHSRLYTPDLCAQFLSAFTGQEFNASVLLEAGERIWNLERIFNIREGFGRKDDMPPIKWLTEPITFEGKEYPPLDRVSIDEMLDSYYEERNWDTFTGFPKPEKLKQLGLEDYSPKID